MTVFLSSSGALLAADLVAILVLVFALFVRRHRRRDLVVAFLGVNVGVLAVASALSTSTVGAGLGLGLFGVLSIIRLRSEELAQHEIAYYFASLALGLLGGLTATSPEVSVALMALVVGAVWVGDHPRVAGSAVAETVLLDRAIFDPDALAAYVEQLLGVRPTRLEVQRRDLVNDTTLVQVRYDAARRRATLREPVAR